MFLFQIFMQLFSNPTQPHGHAVFADTASFRNRCDRIEKPVPENKKPPVIRGQCVEKRFDCRGKRNGFHGAGRIGIRGWIDNFR